MNINRRDALKTIALGSVVLAARPWSLRAEEVTPALAGAGARLHYPYSVPELPYAYEALAGFIDAETMRIHHGRHHAAYVTGLNKALESHAGLHATPLAELLAQGASLPESVRTAVRNHGGGHANHSLFWQILNPVAGTEPEGQLAQRLVADLGSVQACRDQLRQASLAVFGSGWAWLALKDGKLAVFGTPNQDSPLMQGAVPLLGIDVWEHAYYLRYQNKRADYVDAVLQHLNWSTVAALLPA